MVEGWGIRQAAAESKELGYLPVSNLAMETFPRRKHSYSSGLPYLRWVLRGESVVGDVHHRQHKVQEVKGRHARLVIHLPVIWV